MGRGRSRCRVVFPFKPYTTGIPLTLSGWLKRLRAHGANLDAWEREERDLAQNYRDLWRHYITLLDATHCRSCKEPLWVTPVPPDLALNLSARAKG